MQDKDFNSFFLLPLIFSVITMKTGIHPSVIASPDLSGRGNLYLLLLEGGGLRWGWSRGLIHQARLFFSVIARQRSSDAISTHTVGQVSRNLSLQATKGSAAISIYNI